MSSNSTKNIVNFLFEVGILSRTPRSGFFFLGTGEQSVAEHINRVVFIGYSIAMMEGDVDTGKVLKMCLLHDIAEGRVSDLNYIHQKYVEKKEDEAARDLASSLPFGDDILKTLHEYEARESKEAIVAKDADNLEWIFSLKEQYDTGNDRAYGWVLSAIRRLKTRSAQKIAEEMLETDSTEWWDNEKGPAAEVTAKKHNLPYLERKQKNAKGK
jgi:putative hydrolases of HD superfamily